MRRSISKRLTATLLAGMLVCGMSADAFAEPVVGEDAEYTPSGSDSDVQAGSDIAMYSSVEQLRVSIPTNISLALTYDGGQFSAPSPRVQEEASVRSDTVADETSGTYYRKARSGYGIENLSDFDIYVKNCEGSTKYVDPETGAEKSSGFSIGEKGWEYDYSTGDRYFDNTTRDGYISEFYVELRHPGFEPNDVNSQELILREGAVTGVDDRRYRQFWSIGRAQRDENGIVVPTVFGVSIFGFNSTCTAEIPTKSVQAQHAFSIKWTLAPLS